MRRWIRPNYYGFNKDHLDLYDSDPANYHGEGLASDFFKPSGPNQFTQWSNPNTDLPGSSALPTNLAVTNITSNGTIMTLTSFIILLPGQLPLIRGGETQMIISSTVL